MLQFRGGLVPEAKDSSPDEYYDQFELDYGTSDNKRTAGALKGFIKSGALSALPESDSFIKWIFQHLEKGPEPPNSRLKAYYVSVQRFKFLMLLKYIYMCRQLTLERKQT